MTDDRLPGGIPLDAEAAAVRARQAMALSAPERLRLMSVLATAPDTPYGVGELAELLGSPGATVAEHLATLREEGLVETRPGAVEARYAPTAEAWVRFGRLLSGKSPYSAPPPRTDPTPLDRLPHPIRKVADRLAYRFSSHFSAETVARYVAESYDLLAARASTSRHLPSLTSRFATDRLAALASAQGFDISGTPELLFVCVRNSGRSQLAAAIARQLSGGRVHVRTAGSRPAAAIDAAIVDALDEIGVPIVDEFPKPLTDEVVQAADVVVTMGCGDACPVYPGRRYLDWAIDDPADADPETLRGIRDDVLRRVSRLLSSIGIEPVA